MKLNRYFFLFKIALKCVEGKKLIAYQFYKEKKKRENFALKKREGNSYPCKNNVIDTKCILFTVK